MSNDNFEEREEEALANFQPDEAAIQAAHDRGGQEEAWCERKGQEKRYLMQVLSWTGDQYDEGRTLKEVCAIVRGLLKAAVKDGTLPGPHDFVVRSAEGACRVQTYHSRKMVEEALMDLFSPWQQVEVGFADDGYDSFGEHFAIKLEVVPRWPTIRDPKYAELKKATRSEKSREKRSAILGEQIYIEHCARVDEMVKHGFTEEFIRAKYPPSYGDHSRVQAYITEAVTTETGSPGDPLS